MVVNKPNGYVKPGSKIFRSYFKQFDKTHESKTVAAEELTGWNCIIVGPITDWDADYKTITDSIGEFATKLINKTDTKFKDRVIEAVSRGFVVVVGYEQIWATKATNLKEIQAETSQEIFS